MELEQLLKKYFGYNSFKPGQKEVITSILEGNHTLAMLPTGTGKSLCYQLLGYIFEGAIIIVSPLLSLMQDQVEQMMSFGEKRVIAINSFLTYDEKKNVLHNIKKYKFIFLSPEMLHVKSLLQILKTINISLFVIDEAHCISQWGYDFRPEYLKLGEIRKSLGNPLTLGLTATATNQVREDIISSLGLVNVKKIVSSVDRPNIALYMKQFADYQEKQSQLIELVNNLQPPGIIYFSSKKAAEQTALLLKENGIKNIMAYHGGVDQEQRVLIQQQFIQGQLDIICATSAFGMGVNKENIRFIIHYHMPLQIESYLQEIGRAGRDGNPSIAVLLHCPGDEQLPLLLIERELPTMKQIDWLFSRIGINGNSLILDENLMSLGGFTETQWRIMKEFSGNLNEQIEDLERIKENIKDYVLKRNKVKYENLFLVKKWMESNGCRRNFIFNYFEEKTNLNVVENCCDHCGVELSNYKINGKRNFSEMSQENWIDYLAKILLV
ncbi:ATP-dependent DNA helicase RecQ [Neobacillus sp. PS3-12]|uniref:RecQ family ATP-dependent DNA helicase n=1 Tax=Neobacillus sp. PS3-12 TaxID=3070677 RepID=UPI0027E14A02|nr:ATP-dependent DNA helicase RecQ [Neobacillus sp. PS3-12]WML53923.1 ATP-dependent DNA helicase RecQ [Neobacillus sp. PS3-12]